MSITLSESEQKKIDNWLLKFPDDQKQSALLYALRVVQEENHGWLSERHIEAVADYLSVPRILAFEVATFYTMYNLTPVGRHKIDVCTNISCMLRGSNRIIDHFRDRLGINVGETSPDGFVTLREVECLAACANAPVMQINDRDYFEDLTPEKIDNVLHDLRNRETGNG